MAARIRARHQDEIRAKIQTSQLINRLEGCALGEVELTAQQLKAIEILLKKNLPDLSQVEISGDPENPLSFDGEFRVKLVKSDAG
jgi:hypothetical protein